MNEARDLLLPDDYGQSVGHIFQGVRAAFEIRPAAERAEPRSSELAVVVDAAFDTGQGCITRESESVGRAFVR